MMTKIERATEHEVAEFEIESDAERVKETPKGLYVLKCFAAVLFIFVLLVTCLLAYAILFEGKRVLEYVAPMVLHKEGVHIVEVGDARVGVQGLSFSKLHLQVRRPEVDANLYISHLDLSWSLAGLRFESFDKLSVDHVKVEMLRIEEALFGAEQSDANKNTLKISDSLTLFSLNPIPDLAISTLQIFVSNIAGDQVQQIMEFTGEMKAGSLSFHAEFLGNVLDLAVVASLKQEGFATLNFDLIDQNGTVARATFETDAIASAGETIPAALSVDFSLTPLVQVLLEELDQPRDISKDLQFPSEIYESIARVTTELESLRRDQYLMPWVEEATTLFALKGVFALPTDFGEASSWHLDAVIDLAAAWEKPKATSKLEILSANDIQQLKLTSSLKARASPNALTLEGQKNNAIALEHYIESLEKSHSVDLNFSTLYFERNELAWTSHLKFAGNFGLNGSKFRNIDGHMKVERKPDEWHVAGEATIEKNVLLNISKLNYRDKFEDTNLKGDPLRAGVLTGISKLQLSDFNSANTILKDYGQDFGEIKWIGGELQLDSNFKIELIDDKTQQFNGAIDLSAKVQSAEFIVDDIPVAGLDLAWSGTAKMRKRNDSGLNYLWSTKDTARVSISKLNPGVEVSNAKVLFSSGAKSGFEDAWLRVDSAVAEVFKGEAVLEKPFEFKIAKPSGELTLLARSWDMETLLKSSGEDSLIAKGRVDGVFPLTFTSESIAIENGKIAASDDGGVIRYRPQGGKEAYTGGDERLQLVFDALENFSYRELKGSIALDSSGLGTISLPLNIKGKNLDQPGMREIHLNPVIQYSGLKDVLKLNRMASQLMNRLESRYSKTD